MKEYLNTALDEKFNEIDSLTWLPFIGRDYFNEKNKTIIIGESHYVPDGEDPELYEDKTWTRHFVLKEGLQIKPWNLSDFKNPLIRNIEKVLGVEGSHETWNKMAYFNLIQRLLPSMDDRPDDEDIKVGLNTFKKVVRLLDSDRIIFCGVKAAKYFQNLLHDESFQIEQFKFETNLIDGAYPKSFLLEFGGKKRFCYFIRHPSGSHGGFSPAKWKKFIEE